MRNLTDRELKAVEKFRDNFNCEIATAVSNGMILDMIRYAKRLKLKKDKAPNVTIKPPAYDVITEGGSTIFINFCNWINKKSKKQTRDFIERGI